MLEDRQGGKGTTAVVRLVDIWGKEGLSEWLDRLKMWPGGSWSWIEESVASILKTIAESLV